MHDMETGTRITVDDVAQMLGVDVSTVRRMVAAKELDYVDRVGKRGMYPFDRDVIQKRLDAAAAAAVQRADNARGVS